MTKRKKAHLTGSQRAINKYFDAQDRTLKDIKSTNETMGGIPVILCGDFRQILPMTRSDTGANIMNAYIKKLYLWKEVKRLKLTSNMCLSAWG